MIGVMKLGLVMCIVVDLMKKPKNVKKLYTENILKGEGGLYDSTRSDNGIWND